MKAKYSFLLVVMIFTCSSLTGQKNLSSNPYMVGDTVTIKLDNLGDSIQWQESLDLLNWTDIPGQNLDSLVHVVDTSKYVRARVVHGNCAPYFSDTLQITANLMNCPPTVTDYDGNVYNTVSIGDQCWMKENLKATHYSDGTAIPNISDPIAWRVLGDNTFEKAYCFYNNDTSSEYGALYSWAAAMNGAYSSNTNPSGVQGVCPNGWHLPSDLEWTELTDSLGGVAVAGGKLKEFGAIHWNSPNVDATNSSGFTGLPGGGRTSDYGTFVALGASGYWWSTAVTNYVGVWCRRLDNTIAQVARVSYYMSSGFSVRCIYGSNLVQPNFPIVLTDSIGNITQSTASCVGEVVNSGGDSVITRGICWNTTGMPTVSNSFLLAGSGIGSFTCSMANLSTSTTYFVRAFANNSVGTSYGNEISFTTLNDTTLLCGDSIADIDGNIYIVVHIGNQCWMAENLRVTHYPNGDIIPYITNAADWLGLGYWDPGYCYYNHDTSYATTYGALYTWMAMADSSPSSNSIPSNMQGICPSAWHIPSDEEWKILQGFADSQYIYPSYEWNNWAWQGTDVGTKLRTKYGWYNNGDGIDSHGFAAYPTGEANWTSFSNLGYYASFWTSTKYGTGNTYHAIYRKLVYSGSTIYRGTSYMDIGRSIRCVKD
ncbi:MAG: fibrobacter succinogenes major paralogous domain-containing protein [Bacteroidales bacterium]|nr:fibrobacter succinogenes major paralogous domain-containing protein [Bacteroidales bacterium]MCF8458093.1 fibrobacter succinogenes major paralogous domain-containing protein [Bacteroidales bacterium]